MKRLLLVLIGWLILAPVFGQTLVFVGGSSLQLSDGRQTSGSGHPRTGGGNGPPDHFFKLWQESILALFLKDKLIEQDRASLIRSWVHSGFSVESETRMLDRSAKAALGEYAVRVAVSEQRISYDSSADVVTWSARANGFFDGKVETGATGTALWTLFQPSPLKVVPDAQDNPVCPGRMDQSPRGRTGARRGYFRSFWRSQKNGTPQSPAPAYRVGRTLVVRDALTSQAAAGRGVAGVGRR
jgi:hypothetical protein